MVDWTEIDTVLLDMDGTLLDLHFDNHFWLHHLPTRYAEIKGMPIADAISYLKADIQGFEGTLEWYCVDFWSERLNIDISALKREIKDKIALRPDTTPFLKWLGETGKRRILITNAHRKSLDIKLGETQLDRHLDRLISSHDYRAPKESAAFWHQLQQEEGFNPARALFIDDTARILTFAKQHGIGHVLGIHQPDSRILRKMIEHPAIDDFHEIMPPINTR